MQTTCRTYNVIHAVSGMASVQGELIPRLNAAFVSMIQGVHDATNSQGVAESGVMEALKTMTQVGLSQASTESYYLEDQDDCQAHLELASRGLGPVGSVRVAPSPCQKWVPRGLCKRYQEWESDRVPELSKGRGVKEMLKAIRMARGLKATANTQATGRAVVILKNSAKRSMILSCRKQNHASGVEPKGFRLP